MDCYSDILWVCELSGNKDDTNKENMSLVDLEKNFQKQI